MYSNKINGIGNSGKQTVPVKSDLTIPAILTTPANLIIPAIPTMLTILVIWVFLILPSSLGAQEYYSTRSIVVEDLIGKIARESENELDYETLFQDIYYFLENPLNLNSATKEELEKLHLLTDFQILSLQHYIKENGPLLSIYELPLVYGFDELSARTLEPLVVLEPPSREMPAGKRKSSHQLLMRVSSVLE
jgi:hypothetical protein